jgi:hypothetical protein
MVPGRRSAVELKMMIPHLSIVEKIKWSVLYAFVFRCATKMEIPLTMSEPCQGVTGTIEFGKFDLMWRLVIIGTMVIATIMAPAMTIVGGGATEVSPPGLLVDAPMGMGTSRAACAEESSPASASSQSTKTPSVCCCCLTSRTSTVMERTISTYWSNFWDRPAMESVESLLEPAPITRGVMAWPGTTDTRLSPVGLWRRLWIVFLRLYHLALRRGSR